jgi:hypothetical protein
VALAEGETTCLFGPSGWGRSIAGMVLFLGLVSLLLFISTVLRLATLAWAHK